MSEIMRLDKFIASQRTDISRKDVKELCKKGKIFVNDKIAKQSDIKIDAEKDRISVDGAEISYNKYIYIMLNKPKGVVCSTRDGASPTVLSLLPPELNRKGLFPAGRLDKDTEGFVLITDDGGLAHRILSPRNHVEKKYYVELLNPVGENYAGAFSSGMEIDGGDICKPAKLIPIEDNKNACYVILHEGMFHQIKRMFEKLGNKVTYLKRISIGGLVLDDNLQLGECLVILHKDVEKYL